MIPADDALFVDANVLVYASIQESEAHQIALRRLDELHQSGRELWVSRQVLREYLSVITKRNYFLRPLSRMQAIAAVHEIGGRFRIADETMETGAQLIALLSRFEVAGRQVHDCNIVATMLERGIKSLLTDNTRNFSIYGGLISLEHLR